MKWSKVVLFLGAGAVAGAFGVALAGEPETVLVVRQVVPHVARTDGAAMYQAYCASCHGEQARGDGCLARLLKTPPKDLTRLEASGNPGFPAAHVRYVLLDAHSSHPGAGADMPAWGEVWQGMDRETPGGAMLRVANLVDYLESVQAH